VPGAHRSLRQEATYGIRIDARPARKVTMLGRTVSHYRIEEKIGEGGMGIVYRARDLNLPRSAAIKFLSSNATTEDQRRRFQQEAQTASSLSWLASPMRWHVRTMPASSIATSNPTTS
jgi:serine/threonine protein kinase